jgi:hypothetical protein
MAAKYKSLNLFDGALKLPLKLTKANEALGESEIHYGYEGARLNMIYVKAKEGVKKVASPQDIDVVVPFSKIEKIIEDSGKIIKLTEYPDLVQLIEDNKTKKNDPEIEVMGIFNMSELPIERLSGEQYHVFTGSKEEKVPNAKNMQVYQYLKNFLTKEKKYIHIKYYWNCPTTQKIGILYATDQCLKIAGMYSDLELRKIKEEPLEIKENVEVSNLFGNKLTNFYKDNKDNNKGLMYDIEWYREYLKGFASKGLDKKQKKINKNDEDYVKITNNDLLTFLNDL